MYNDLRSFILAFYILIKDIFRVSINIIIKIINFLNPLENSIRGFISPEEFYRVLLLAISGAGSFHEGVQYLQKHANEFITDDTVLNGVNGFVKHCVDKNLPMALFVILLVWDYIRRKYIHGNKQ